MKKAYPYIKNTAVSLVCLTAAFAISLIIQNVFSTQALIPSIFVLAVLVVSILTDGYAYGIASALISVVAVNYAFTFPFFKLNFSIPENLVSAVIMIVIALLTSALTVKLKRQEALKAESEKEKMRANLLRAVSHDLRTPLTAIYGSSSAILENNDSLTEEQKKGMIKGIRDEAKWLTRMVENLLSITKIDSGNVRILKAPTVLDELVDSVIRKFKKQYEEVKINLDLPEELMMIPMDAMLIEQVILNIFENSVQHAEGMSEITLKVCTDSDRAVFEISDDGCGISEEKLKDLFNGVYRSSDNQKRNAGIGLSVCATIIKAHGGEIKAENASGGGAVFKFSLNIEEAEDEHEQI